MFPIHWTTIIYIRLSHVKLDKDNYKQSNFVYLSSWPMAEIILIHQIMWNTKIEY